MVYKCAVIEQTQNKQRVLDLSTAKMVPRSCAVNRLQPISAKFNIMRPKKMAALLLG